MTIANRLPERDLNAIIDALVSARKHIGFLKQVRPKGSVYDQGDAEVLRKIAAALATLDFEGNGEADDDD